VPRGAATLRSMWQGGAATSPDQPDPRLRGLIQVGAIVLLVVVIVVALNVTPLWLR
jgi:hypothetical protein